jgi:hypothetical protein
MRRLGNRGQTVAMAWVYVISQIFAVGFIYLILDSLVRIQLYNIAIDMHADSTLITTIVYVWNILPFLYIGASILYGIVYTIRRGGEGDYYA